MGLQSDNVLWQEERPGNNLHLSPQIATRRTSSKGELVTPHVAGIGHTNGGSCQHVSQRKDNNTLGEQHATS